MSRLIRISEWLLRQPLVWGGLASMAFYALIVEPADKGGLVARAFTGELWQFKAAAMLVCSAGLAALAMRLLGLAVEFGALERQALPPAAPEGQPASAVDDLLAELDAASPSYAATCVGARLRRALEQIRLRGSADALENDLRTLADEDRRALDERYSALRFAAACVLLIGVAGAAAAVAVALPGVAGKPFDAALPVVFEAVGAACGGVVQAITLAIVLLVAKSPVQRIDARLLAAVDAAAARQLIGRFATYGTEKDPHVAAIQRISEKVLETVESAAERHDAALSKSLATATRRWEDMAATAGSVVHRSLGEAVTAGLEQHAATINAGVARLTADLQSTLVRHAEVLGENIDHHTAALADALEHHTAVMTATETSLAAENQRHLAHMEGALGESMLLAAARQEKLIQQSEELLKEMQVALVEAAGTTVAQQEQLIKQSDVLLKVVEATGQIRKLEEALNGNLLALSTSHNFEQTVTSLAAAVQLLSIRLRQPAIVRNEVDLNGETKSQAA